MPIQRVAVVTGSSSGFGLLTAVALARRGLRVYATMRDPSRAAALRRALEEAGVTASLLPLDVLSAESVRDAIATIEREAGRVDVLVNNAGIMVTGFAEDVDEDALRRQFDTNFFGAVRVTRAVLGGMRERCYGRVICVSSLGGRVASPMFSAYHSSKFALEGYCEALRHEVRPYNVFVSLIEPGLFPTELFDRNWEIAGASGDPTSPNYAASQKITDAFRRGLAYASLNNPARVARTIARVATARRPRVRYLVGVDAKLTYGVAKLAPRWWEDYMSSVTSPPE